MRRDRIDESREKMLKAFYFALGSYMEQEAKKADTWRDQGYGELYAHLKHELEEIKRSMTANNLTYMIHNCVDVVLLSNMLLARAMEENNLL